MSDSGKTSIRDRVCYQSTSPSCLCNAHISLLQDLYYPCGFGSSRNDDYVNPTATRHSLVGKHFGRGSKQHMDVVAEAVGEVR